jgi:hypothetical protein
MAFSVYTHGQMHENAKAAAISSREKRGINLGTGVASCVWLFRPCLFLGFIGWIGLGCGDASSRLVAHLPDMKKATSWAAYTGSGGCDSGLVQGSY